MLSLSDFYVLHQPLVEEVQRLLPVPASVDFACWDHEGVLHPIQPHWQEKAGVATAGTETCSDPRMIDDRLVLPLALPSKERVAVVISGVDPALLRKMSTGWLRDLRTTLLDELELLHWGYVDSEVSLYNRRAAMAVFANPALAQHTFFLLVHTVFPRRTAAGNLQKLREIADLLQALTRASCFSFGYGVFGVLLQVENRDQAMKTSHYLQHQLKREGLRKVHISCAQLNRPNNQDSAQVHDRLWRALAIAEQRGPFGLCDIDSVEQGLPYPFHLTRVSLLNVLRKHWRGLTRFTLVMLSRQKVSGAAKWPASSLTGQLAEGVIALGEEDNLSLVLLPDKGPTESDEQLAVIRARYELHYGEGWAVAFGVAFWPCLDFHKNDIPGNCLKALMHGSYLGPGSTVVFDHVSLNISGDFFFDEGDYRAAIREYRRGLCLQPDDPNLMNSLGVALVECGEERQAAACFEKVLYREPTNSMALVNLGHVRHVRGRKEEALECFERAYRVQDQALAVPQDLLLPLGKLYAELGEHAKALAVFEHWRTSPESDREFLLHRLLGQSYLENGRLDEAIRECQRALQLFPQDSVSLSTLGLLYVLQGEGNEVGLTLCRKALTLDNFNPDHWYRLSRALLHAGDRAGALAAIRQCLQLSRGHVEGLLLLGRISLLGGKMRRAEQCFRQAKAARGCTPSQEARAHRELASLGCSNL